MKLLQLDTYNYAFPDGIESIDELIKLINDGHKFIKLTRYSELRCVEPYFIEEDYDVVWVNLSQITYIKEIEGEILPHAEYQRRLSQIVRKKCPNCTNFDGDFDNLDGHYDRMCLDGTCSFYISSKLTSS